jgi:hypothetical protein
VPTSWIYSIGRAKTIDQLTDDDGSHLTLKWQRNHEDKGYIGRLNRRVEGLVSARHWQS